MSVLVVWASPNKNGFTALCKDYAEIGIKEASKEFKTINLNEFDIRRCNICESGYGICNTENICCIDDDFNKIQDFHIKSDAIIIISPVYWSEMSESAKTFYDRLRRCQAKTNNLKDKKCIVIAGAGGSGNGAVKCLEQMERTMQNIGMNVVDRLPIIRFSKDYMLQAIKSSAKKLCEEL